MAKATFEIDGIGRGQQLRETNGSDARQAVQPKGAPRNIWAFRISVLLFVLWLAWLVYLALGLLFG